MHSDLIKEQRFRLYMLDAHSYYLKCNLVSLNDCSARFRSYKVQVTPSTYKNN